MEAFEYTVTATFRDTAIRPEYVAWQRDGHVQAVVAGGALRAEVSEVDAGPGAAVKTRYLFPDRNAYERYVRETAPSLRADGMKRFPPERGVSMVRETASVVFVWKEAQSHA